MLMGSAVRSVETAGALEAILTLSVAYANERVAFERKIGKFQAVQQNLARLAGEVAAALAVSGSAADTLSNSDEFDDAVFLEAASAKIRCAEAASEGSSHRAPGVRRYRLHAGAHLAPLHAAHAGLARRLRQ